MAQLRSRKHNRLWIDVIPAFMLTTAISPVLSAEICDIDTDGSVTEADINLIFQARDTLAQTPFDARDIDRDGRITVKDGRQCVCLFSACVSGLPPINQSPVTNAGPDQFSSFQNNAFQTLVLDGSASQDPDGDALSHQWALQSQPSGSQAVLMDANTAIAHFTPDRAGRYEVALTTTDGFGLSQTKVIVITAENSAPVANAGPDQSVESDASGLFGRVTLDAGASRDVDGDRLNYTWVFIEKPAGSQALLNDPNAATPSFIPDLDGRYALQLQVGDGQLNGAPDTVVITASGAFPPLPDNNRPIANAGSDQSVARDANGAFNPVTLDAGASSDVDGDHLNYTWAFIEKPAGSQALLNDPSAATPSFIPDLNGRYVLQLQVGDGQLNGDPDTVVITASGEFPPPDNTLPVANAGPDQSIVNASGTFNPVTLNGSTSTDADGDALAYRWVLAIRPAGSLAVLANPNAVMPVFIPDLAGQYQAQLTVNDGSDDSLPDSVVIEVGALPNTAPVANAGADQTGQRDESGQFRPVDLDGSQSTDINGDPLNYNWSFLSVPPGSQVILTNPNTVTPGFTPDLPGRYEVQLLVGDGLLNSPADTVVITTDNTRPIANAGADQTVFRNENSVFDPVTLEGGQSTDLDGDTLNYVWSIIARPEGSQAQLDNPTSVMPNLTPDLGGDYVIQLIVNDGFTDSPADTVVITTGNTRPLADAGEDRVVTRSDSGDFAAVMLEGSGSTDVDGDALTYRWSLLSPDTCCVTLNDPNSVQPVFTPTTTFAGDYVWQLIVDDGQLESEPDTVVISAEALPPPVANAGPDQTLTVVDGVLGSVTLDGSGSTRSGSGPLNYQWSLISRPAESQAVLTHIGNPNPVLLPDISGTYIAQLIVNDGFSSSVPDTVMLTADNNIPVADAGPDQIRVPLNTSVILDGSGSSDADNDSLVYQWSLINQPPVNNPAVLSNPNSVNPEFILNSIGTYVAQLVVNDGRVNSSPDTVTITSNRPPIANAGADQVINTTDTTVLIPLDGSASSDADNDTLSYRWSILVDPGVDTVLNNPNTATPSLASSGPTIRGTYTLQLVVNDSKIDSTADTVLITINTPPSAGAIASNLGTPFSDTGTGLNTYNVDITNGPQPVLLDGGNSFDPEAPSQTLSYRWSITPPPGSNAQLDNANSQTPTFTADQSGSYVIQLIVNDGLVDSPPVEIIVSAFILS